MILWKRKEPITIGMLEALIRRIPVDNYMYPQLEEKLAREKSGFYGEERLDREWLDFKIDPPYILLNGLKFENNSHFTHQIDTLFICQHFICVMEVKNISGKVEIDDEKNQCIRTRQDGTEEGFTNPVDQVRRHGFFLKNLLREMNITIPVICTVVFTNANSVIGRVNAKDVQVFHVSGLRYKVSRWFAKNPQPLITREKMNELVNKLIARRCESSWRPDYDRSVLRTGALCRQCSYKSQMKFRYGKWSCTKCGKVDNQAFYQALNDYRLLWNMTISKKDFCDFFNIASMKTAYRILMSLNLKTEGSYRDRKYILPQTISERRLEADREK